MNRAEFLRLLCGGLAASALAQDLRADVPSAVDLTGQKIFGRLFGEGSAGP